MRPSGAAFDRPMLEREEELAVLNRLVEECENGNGGLVMIEGPAGIGKTRLVRSACAVAAQRDMRVLETVASELESSFAYGVLHSLFEPPLAKLTAHERKAILAGPARSAGSLFGLGPGPGGTGSPDLALTLQHGLYWLAMNLAALQPLLIVLDDAHWADRVSLGWLAYLARRIDGVPLGVAVASRPAEPGAESDLVSALAGIPGAKVLRPEALSVAGTEQIVASQLGVSPGGVFAAGCHRVSGGNPLLLEELLRVLAEEGVKPSPEEVERLDGLRGPALGRAALARAGRLAGDAATTLKALAVLGPRAEPEQVATLAGVRP